MGWSIFHLIPGRSHAPLAMHGMRILVLLVLLFCLLFLLVLALAFVFVCGFVLFFVLVSLIATGGAATVLFSHFFHLFPHHRSTSSALGRSLLTPRVGPSAANAAKTQSQDQHS